MSDSEKILAKWTVWCATSRDNVDPFDEIERLRRIEAAAEKVCWFDWSENDDDAVAAITALRDTLPATHSS